ncbi:MAG: hypothetical protein O4965_13470 [Trichodesmium sp. St19_bin1]|nr:hypothetical protein [Trichodesmium sp. St19_bin1]
MLSQPFAWEVGNGYREQKSSISVVMIDRGKTLIPLKQNGILNIIGINQLELVWCLIGICPN